MAGHPGRQRGVRGGRRIVHKVKVTGEQERRLQQLAAAQGVTVARLLVDATLTSDGWSPAQRRTLGAELMGARRTLTGLGTNLNQMTAHANAERRFVGDVMRLVPMIERAIAQLETAVEGLRA